MTVAAAEPLARHTTFHIGGPAELYATANSIAQLERLAESAHAHAIPTTIVGGGSNILVSDAGISGLVIANKTRCFGMEGGLLVADSGVSLAGLARWACKNGWAGLEWAVSVPGTVGGAVIGNAGAHGGDMAGSLAWTQVLFPGADQRRLTRAELAYTYRSSLLKQQISAQVAVRQTASTPIVLAAAFALQPGAAADITARADLFLAKRRASQPVEPSAGSVFRNPPGDYAGRLIEAAGLKGERIGGAQISPRHANFIVNVEAATADDVIGLLDLARRRVFDQFGVELLPEILFVGDWRTQPPYAPLFEM